MPKTLSLSFAGHIVQWTIERGARNNWIAICDPLSLTVEAKTVDALVALANETMDVLYREIELDGDLDAFVAEHLADCPVA